MVLKVATAAEIANANAAAVAASTPAPTAPANGESAKARQRLQTLQRHPTRKSAAGAKPQRRNPELHKLRAMDVAASPANRVGVADAAFSQVDCERRWRRSHRHETIRAAQRQTAPASAQPHPATLFLLQVQPRRVRPADSRVCLVEWAEKMAAIRIIPACRPVARSAGANRR